MTALCPTICLVPCPYVTGSYLTTENLHVLSREQAGELVQRLITESRPDVILEYPDILAFFGVRNLLERATVATEQGLLATFRSLWPEASVDFRHALEIGYANALRAIGVGAPAQVVRAAVNEFGIQ